MTLTLFIQGLQVAVYPITDPRTDDMSKFQKSLALKRAIDHAKFVIQWQYFDDLVNTQHEFTLSIPSKMTTQTETINAEMYAESGALKIA